MNYFSPKKGLYKLWQGPTCKSYQAHRCAFYQRPRLGNQLNMVSWNGNPPKYDIRDWSPDGKPRQEGASA